MPHKDRAVYNEYMRQRLALRRSDFRARFQALKADLACGQCGENDSRCLDFHHRDPSAKSGSVGVIVSRATWRWERILDEVAKCDVLCANCHRKEHMVAA